MEADDEIKSKKGTSYDFGARIYDPRVARWFSPDLLESKYPNLSPYHFVDNCPIKFIDYNGDDFGVKIDHEKKTIIYVANVYTTSEKAYSEALKSAGVWNEKSAVIDGYTVSFDVKVKESFSTTDQEVIDANPEKLYKRNGKIKPKEMERYKGIVNNSKMRKALTGDEIGNLYESNHGKYSQDVSGSKFVGGRTGNGQKISMNNHDEFGDMATYEDLVTHEMGHLFGLDDVGGEHYSESGIMKYKGLKLNPISDDDIQDIINFTKMRLDGGGKSTDAEVIIIEEVGTSSGNGPLDEKDEN